MKEGAQLDRPSPYKAKGPYIESRRWLSRRILEEINVGCGPSSTDGATRQRVGIDSSEWMKCEDPTPCYNQYHPPFPLLFRRDSSMAAMLAARIYSYLNQLHSPSQRMLV